jgi:PhnB protein
MITMNPYINLTDQSEAALDFYKSVFGGNVEITRFKDMADSGMPPVAAEHQDLLMHGVLKTDDFQLMIADSAPMGPTTPGNNITVSLAGDDDAKLTKYYEGLSDGGKIEMPLDKAPWGDKFSMFTDKFGVKWMVNITAPKA